MNYSSIISTSCVDSSGWSVVLQVSGCDFKCKGCFNTFAQNPKYGIPFTQESLTELYKALNKDFIDNFVIQGGDPLYETNYNEITSLCRRVKKDFHDKNIVVFTGYTYKEVKGDLLRSPILDTIDYLVDGRYEKDNPTKKPFRGSDNQIIHKIECGVSVSQS